MAMHRFTIPCFRFSTLNSMLGRHWSLSHRLKKNDREMVGAYSRIAGIPKAEGKRRVSLEVVIVAREKITDPDALWKSCLDSLVACGLLVDDSPRYCELGTVTYRRDGEPGTTIVLTDCGVEP